MQPDAKIPIPDSAPFADAGRALVEKAKTIAITCQGEFGIAGEELRHVTRLQSRVKDAFREPKRLAHEAHKAITSLEANLLALPAQAERLIKETMGDYLQQEERKRREEQLRLQAEELRKADEAKLQEAIALEDAGELDAAEQTLSAPTIAPVIELERPRAEGISSRKKWKWTSINESERNRPFLSDNTRKIDQTVAAMGPDAAELVGGIRVYEDVIVVARR